MAEGGGIVPVCTLLTDFVESERTTPPALTGDEVALDGEVRWRRGRRVAGMIVSFPPNIDLPSVECFHTCGSMRSDLRFHRIELSPAVQQILEALFSA